MASTLIKRMVSPDLLTDEERAAVDAEVDPAYNAEEGYKLAIKPVTAVAQEVVEGRMPATTMLAWITLAEKVDADILIANVVGGTMTLDWIERLLVLGERGIYDHTTIEAILGFS